VPRLRTAETTEDLLSESEGTAINSNGIRTSSFTQTMTTSSWTQWQGQGSVKQLFEASGRSVVGLQEEKGVDRIISLLNPRPNEGREIAHQGWFQGS